MWRAGRFCLLYDVVVYCLYTENKGVGVMKPGHSFTIEPMINEGLLSFQLNNRIN